MGSERRQFGHYLVGGILGRGGMATVFAAKDRRTGRAVAVKVLRPELLDHPEARARFIREARASIQIQHPNVVQVLDAGVESGVPFLAMERLRGESLQDVLTMRRQLSSTETLEILVPVMEALALLHARGLVHRDIKPSNIFLDEGARGPTPKLLDFGIAKLLGDDSAGLDTEHPVGTPHYMPPELLDGASATPAVDVWSMGIVLYRCLTGELPFVGGTREDLLEVIRSGEHVALHSAATGAPAPLLETVERALSPDPAQRFADMGSFLRELHARRQIAPADFRPAPDFSARQRWLRAGLAGLIAVAFVAVLIRLLSIGDRVQAEPLLPAPLGGLTTEEPRGAAEASDARGTESGGDELTTTRDDRVRRDGRSDRGPQTPSRNGTAPRARRDAPPAPPPPAAAPGREDETPSPQAAGARLERELPDAPAPEARPPPAEPPSTAPKPAEKGAPVDVARQAFLRAEEASAAGDVPGAQRALRKALSAYPDFPAALVARARLRRDTGDGAGALRDLNRALELENHVPEIHDERGRTHLGLGRLDAAIEDFVRARSLDKRRRVFTENLVGALFLRAKRRHSLGQLVAAKRDLDRLLKLNPRYALGVRRRAVLLTQQGQTAAARRDFRRYLRLVPDAPDRADVERLLRTAAQRPRAWRDDGRR